MRIAQTIIGCFLLIEPGFCAGPCQSISGQVRARADDGSALSLRVSAVSPADCQAPASPVSIPVKDPALKTRVKEISPGDGVKVDLQGADATASDFDWLSIPAGPPLTVVMPAILLVLALVTLGLAKDLRGLLLIGQDGRYSNSKTQATLWFFVTFVVFVSAYFLRWLGGFTDHISIPQNLLLLSGISAATGATAMIITSQKQQAAVARNAAAAQNAAPVHNAAPVQNAPQKTQGTPNFPSDLVKADDGTFDLGDYQMIVITVIAVVTYLVTAVQFLSHLQQRVATSLPDIDGTMAALFGIGQGAYLTKKAGSDINH